MQIDSARMSLRKLSNKDKLKQNRYQFMGNASLTSSTVTGVLLLGDDDDDAIFALEKTTLDDTDAIISSLLLDPFSSSQISVQPLALTIWNLCLRPIED